ncbi:phospholipid phosphatase 3-like [Saccostrea echinata]|uniref:phospholipid phosphatase 3-like n=1 Tax=Saccostrea echinata TaxID=191078 RepID=UPI002A83BCD4|nr:phospholipid phosphatase 3-like [Saccostrea echinata]
METNKHNIVEKLQKETTLRSTVVKVVIEVGLYVILATFDVLLAYNKVDFFLPFRRGFFCSDLNLMFPYKDLSVKESHVILISFLPTTSIIFITEILRNGRRLKKYCYIQLYYRIIGTMMFGFSLCILFVELTKSCVGSLRPYFFAVCQPNMTLTNCTDHYITDYVCRGVDGAAIIDARKSFPSGHAASVWYGVTFLVIYMHLRIYRRWKRSRAFCPIIQTLAAASALYVGVSRIQDNAHRPVDIFAGATVGIIFAIITIYSSSVLFTEKRTYTHCAAVNSEEERQFTMENET